MAPGLKHWVLGTLAACVLVAIAAISSGNTAPIPSQDPPHENGTRWGGEALRLANAWRSTWERWHVEAYRDALVRAADSARAAGGTAPLLLVDGPSTPAQRAEMNRYLAEIWHQAAPEGFKVAVALVIDRHPNGADTASMPSRHEARGAQYVFPDSLHRDLCLVVMRDEYYATRFFDPHRASPWGFDDAVRWLSQALGPCAFYGAYGIPGREIGRWIAGEGQQFVMYPRWWRVPEPNYGIWWDKTVAVARQPAQWWGYVYSDLPWNGVACYAARRGACAAAVYDTLAVSDSQPTNWNTFQWWRDQALFASPYYLSDLARSLGPDRFSEFWTADVPMDSAVHLASGITLDQWTGDWARGRGLRLPLGPSAPPFDVASGVLAALLALGAAVWYAGRRQIG